MPTTQATDDGRYSNVSREKTTGATYTPPELAGFLADAALRAFELPQDGTIRVLDPAVGDGALLNALLHKLPGEALNRVEVYGFDTNPDAVRQSRRLLEGWKIRGLQIEEKDFLNHVASEFDCNDLFAPVERSYFDIVVANPPYVRTQVLGADSAQMLAKQFDLSGRVDLYYPFLLGISRVLTPSGVASIIVSNRFMTTKSGQAVRSAMLKAYDLIHIWDLGDTKLFDAAVLPAVILGRKGSSNISAKPISLTTVYETERQAEASASSVIAALSTSASGIVQTSDGRRYEVKNGLLDNGGTDDGLWRIATRQVDDWLDRVALKTWKPFSFIGKIRVGVKSTADKVFLRSDWDALPGGRPELLRPLVTRHSARKFKSKVPEKLSNRKEILYPHESSSTGRVAVDISKYPIASAYLNEHRAALEARKYLIEAGRNWYELWVPQDPAAWAQPKLVFPDIADEPMFWMDTDGGVVNGECYWLKADDESNSDLLWLALAIANSSFIKSFYDHKFNNKLYAGRRRFITQYVEQFPLPNPDLPGTREIVQLSKDIHAAIPSAEAERMIRELNDKVWQAFGLTPEEVAG